MGPIQNVPLVLNKAALNTPQSQVSFTQSSACLKIYTRYYILHQYNTSENGLVIILMYFSLSRYCSI